jgi:DNA-binding phage protein
MLEPANGPYRTVHVPKVSRFEKFSYLGTREERAAYMEVIKEEGDPVLCQLASKDVKIAKHISAIARMMDLPYSELVRRIMPRYTFEQLMNLCEVVDIPSDVLTVSFDEEIHSFETPSNYVVELESSESDSDSPSDKL